METPLNHLSATELARRIRQRQLLAVDVVEAYLGHIRSLNPTLNAIVVHADDALAVATERDRQLAAGGPIGPLHGVPFTVKDIIDAGGLPTTLGLPRLANNRAARDATAVARLRGAGAILLGKTNCPPGGSGGHTENELFGRTANPYDLERTPGGSSGGEAAAIAAGMSTCGLGTDSGGSLRVPAHFCGIATLKPTAGRIPVTGVHEEDGPIGSIGDPRTQLGPLARHVEDLGLLLGVLAGPDGRDAGAQPVPLGDPADVQLGSLRVSLHPHDVDAPPDTASESALDDAARALAAAGAHIRRNSLPAGGYQLTQRIWHSYGGQMSASEMYDLLRDWDAYRTAMLEYLETTDLILAAVAPGPAPAHGGDVDFRYTAPYSLTGWPCVVVRAGTSGWLPLGVQLVSGPWSEHVALAAAARIEQDLGGWQPPHIEGPA